MLNRKKGGKKNEIRFIVSHILFLSFFFILVGTSNAVFIGNQTIFDDGCYVYTANRDFNVNSMNVSTCELYIDGLPFCSWENKSFFDVTVNGILIDEIIDVSINGNSLGTLNETATQTNFTFTYTYLDIATNTIEFTNIGNLTNITNSTLTYVYWMAYPTMNYNVTPSGITTTHTDTFMVDYIYTNVEYAPYLGMSALIEAFANVTGLIAIILIIIVAGIILSFFSNKGVVR